MAESQTNKAWNQIFDALNVKDKLSELGYVYISAVDIKKHGSREPRLMCKFDDRESRPKIFKDNNLTVLPLKNGQYSLIQFDGYQVLPDISREIEFLEWPFGNKFETLPKEPRSESQVIDMAHATGLLSHFLGDDALTLTIRGRLRSNPFKFYVHNESKAYKLKAEGVQVEVDAGYESEKVYLIEAKMGERDDFHIRQLYYPMRMWYEEGISKKVEPIFINYANDVISISQYEFEDFWDYSSIKIVKSCNYAFEHDPIKFSLEELLSSTDSQLKEPTDIPFPQADDIRKVRDTIDIISWGYNTRDMIAEFWSVDKRQGDYYANAALYLGLVEKKRGEWHLTESGTKFAHLPTTKRNNMLFQAIISHPVFNEVAGYYCQNQKYPEFDFVCDILQRKTDLDFSSSTLKRRARTVLSWVKYINSFFN